MFAVKTVELLRWWRKCRSVAQVDRMMKGTI